MLASRPWVHRTALGLPVEPDVNSRSSRADGSGSAAGGGVPPTSASCFSYAGVPATRTRSASIASGASASSACPAASAISSWQSVWRMSAVSSDPRRGGVTPTSVAPASAAAPSQKAYSGPFSRSTPTWNRPRPPRPAATSAPRARSRLQTVFIGGWPPRSRLFRIGVEPGDLEPHHLAAGDGLDAPRAGHEIDQADAPARRVLLGDLGDRLGHGQPRVAIGDLDADDVGQQLHGHV